MARTYQRCSRRLFLWFFLLIYLWFFKAIISVSDCRASVSLLGFSRTRMVIHLDPGPHPSEDNANLK